MNEIKKLDKDPFLDFCTKQKDVYGQPFWYYDDHGRFVMNYTCTLNLERVKYAYKQHQKKK